MKRISTGVAGLDVVLDGGREPGAVVVLAGAPGTGKTILAQQACFAAGTAEHKGVYYTTVSEPHTKLIRRLRSEPATAGIPILAASSDPDLAKGADAVVLKPYAWRHLLEVADALLTNGSGLR